MTDDQSMTISITIMPSIIHQGNDVCVPDATFVLCWRTEEHALIFKALFGSNRLCDPLGRKAICGMAKGE